MVLRAAVVVVLALALAGCAEQSAPVPMPLPTTTTTPSAIASAPPDTSATGQKPLFDLTNNATISLANGANPGGRAFIDSLVAAGFDRTQMQLTPDKTAINLDADNVQFSVLVEGECLVGQYGNVGYQSTVLPALSTGTCLIGNTRPIDW
jgi:hypothetical protein